MGYDVEVPLLSIFWRQSSILPSTVIILDSSVVIPFDRLKGEDNPEVVWNTYCFDVVYEREELMNKKVTRTFTVSCEAERNKWTEVISQALTDYEKRKKKERKQKAKKQGVKKNQLPPKSPTSSPIRPRTLHFNTRRSLPSPTSPVRPRTLHLNQVRSLPPPGEECMIFNTTEFPTSITPVSGRENSTS